MLSWLGFGKKEKQPSTEEINNEVQATAEQEQALAADPVEPLNEQLTEEVSEQTVELKTEVLAEPEVTPESTVDSNILDENIENIVTSEPVVVAPVIPKPAVESEDISPVAATEPMSELATEQRPEAILLAEMEAAEHVDVADESIIVDEVTLNVEPQPQETILVEAETTEEIAEVKTESKLGFFARLKKGLSKTRQSLGGGLVDLFRGKQIDDDLFEELETHLLLADVGVETTMKIIDSLTKSASRKQLKDASALYDLLKIELKKTIEGVSKPLVIPEGEGPFVMLMVGVNGVGKTTTIGKLAKQFQAEGKSVMLAAGDTFRAAAVEQLQVWGERNDITVIAQHTGADSASVIFDAISAAKARKVDVIIADTAGRLQNKAHLMEELKKIVRVMKKLDVNAPHEVMLTLDAGTGQNALSQTKLFDEAVGLTGLTITKLDGTAKGGVVFAIADKHSIPIRYLGVGEGIDDLRPFNGDDFIEAIFSN